MTTAGLSLINATKSKLETNLLKLKFSISVDFSNVYITGWVLKLGSSLGIEKLTDVWLKVLGRLSDSIPLFLLKGIFSILQGSLRTGLIGGWFCNFDSMMSTARRYHCWKWMDLQSFVSSSLRRFVTFWKVPFFCESIDVLQKLFVFGRYQP